MYIVDAATDNSAWNTPGDLATDRGRYTLSISFDMDSALDEVFYAQVVATRALAIVKERALVRSAVVEDLFEGVDV